MQKKVISITARFESHINIDVEHIRENLIILCKSSGIDYDRQFDAFVENGQYIVPWMAAEGKFNVKPGDKFHSSIFNYGLRFADCFKEKGKFRYGAGKPFLFEYFDSFWHYKCLQPTVYMNMGILNGEHFKAPLAVYEYRGNLVFIQQASFQIVPAQTQPDIGNGIVSIYRGVGNARRVKLLKSQNASAAELKKVRLLNNLEWFYTFFNSKIAFLAMHSYVTRSEVSHINMMRFAVRNGLHYFQLKHTDKEFMEKAYNLFSVLRNSYTLDKDYNASRKFGPNYLSFRTPASNIALTSFFAGEFEVNVIDNDLLDIIDTHGCEIIE
ncbi:MAG: hypothetical protein PHV30_01840 [Candidatus Margulisbacteria bacterium]|nr:hypothetical protein [Candidatus Margulisiibacteriota bacterium]